MNQAASITLTPELQGSEESRALLLNAFEAQREAYLAAPYPSYEERKQDLLALKRLISENRDALVAAISEDYGNRSDFESKFAEIVTVLDTLAHSIKHLRRWMKPQRRHVDLWT